MRKKYIKIPKDFLKDLKFEIKTTIPHSTIPICYCADCIERREEMKLLLKVFKGA